MLNISITEFLTQQIKCPFYESKGNTDYQDQINLSCDLSDPAGRGNYYHSYIAHSIDENVPFNFKNTSINDDAKKTLRWLNNNFKGLKAEKLVETSFEDSHGRQWRVTGKPDAYKIENDTLIIIDFKYTDKENGNYIKQVVYYAGMMAENNECLKNFKLIIKYLNSEKILELNRDALMALYDVYMFEIMSYAEEAEAKACKKCDRCTNVGCKARIKGVADEIYKVINKYDGSDISITELLPIIYPIVSIGTITKAGHEVIPHKKETQYKSTDETVRIYKEECARRNIKPNVDTKESVTSDEFKRVMGEEVWKQYCIEKRKPINEISKPYCEWE